jgi:hypothetical protein
MLTTVASPGTVRLSLGHVLIAGLICYFWNTFEWPTEKGASRVRPPVLCL